MSNDLVHAMLWQCMFYLYIYSNPFGVYWKNASFTILAPTKLALYWAIYECL
jgi:hypothetical protein